MKIIDLSQLEQYLIDVYRLKNVVRYNTRNVIKKESVAEHSFYVALFTLKICNDYNVDSRTEKRAIIKALLHDMPESELNDITHDVKEKLNLRPFLKKYEDEYFDTHFSEYRSLMKKGDEKTNAIVDYADTMSVYQYVLNEELLGNKSNDIQEILNITKIRIKKCKERLEKIFFGGNE